MGNEGAGFRILKKTIIYAFAIVLYVVILVPIFWILLTSFKPTELTNVPQAVLFEPTLEQYSFVISRANLLDVLGSTILIDVGAALLTTLLASMAAFSLARYRFFGKDSLSFWYLTFWMGPPVAFAIPLFVIFRGLGLFDTHLALMLCYTMFNLPIAIWVIMSFYQEIPREIGEAAMLDGADPFKIYSKIYLPLSLPGLVAAFILAFIFSWNEFLYALILAGTQVKTITLLVSSYWTMAGVLIGPMAATITISIIPALILCWFVQEYIIRGLTFGGIRR